MIQAILTLNAGSSSLKFAVYDIDNDGAAIASGQVDRIGPRGSLRIVQVDGSAIQAVDGSLETHADALKTLFLSLGEAFDELDVVAVGHRVVHGGTSYEHPVVVNDEILQDLEQFCPFAPLHQPHNLAGIHAARAAFPEAPQVACFDTAFHRKHPFVSDTFALPRRYFQKGVRRYGFHGLSYDYVSNELARQDPELASGRVAIAHLGNGASMCGLRDGHSIASSMGFSALDGLPMGTRCGQLDPGVLLYLMTEEGMDASEISELLYRQSGLLGLSGLSNDMRELEASDAQEAREAIAYFTFRIRREIGAMAAALEGLDALIFCGGIGERSALVRSEVCKPLAWLGVVLSEKANADNARIISKKDTPVTVMVIPTDEESVIARATAQLALN